MTTDINLSSHYHKDFFMLIYTTLKNITNSLGLERISIILSFGINKDFTSRIMKINMESEILGLFPA